MVYAAFQTFSWLQTYQVKGALKLQLAYLRNSVSFVYETTNIVNYGSYHIYAAVGYALGVNRLIVLKWFFRPAIQSSIYTKGVIWVWFQCAPEIKQQSSFAKAMLLNLVACFNKTR